MELEKQRENGPEKERKRNDSNSESRRRIFKAATEKTTEVWAGDLARPITSGIGITGLRRGWSKSKIEVEAAGKKRNNAARDQAGEVVQPRNQGWSKEKAG